MKIEALALNYRDLTATAGNRLQITLATGVTYNRGIYLMQLDLLRACIFDTTNIVRTISQAEISITSNQTGWISRPTVATLDPDTLYAGSGIVIGGSADNLPASINLNNVYIPATGTFSISMDIFCAGILATDTALVNMRMLFQFEATEDYFTQQFDINK